MPRRLGARNNGGAPKSLRAAAACVCLVAVWASFSWLSGSSDETRNVKPGDSELAPVLDEVALRGGQPASAATPPRELRPCDRTACNCPRCDTADSVPGVPAADVGLGLARGSLSDHPSGPGATESPLPPDAAARASDSIADLYLSTMRNLLTGAVYQSARVKGYPKGSVNRWDPRQVSPFDAEQREKGLDWPLDGFTMAGGIRLDNVRFVLTRVIEDGVPGGFLEAGVWRGGSSIYAAAVTKALGRPAMPIIVCDSFQGLPKAAAGGNDKDFWSEMDYLRVSQEQVADNFRAVGLLDDRVSFVRGFFDTSLYALGKTMKSGDLAVLRGDGDMYESFQDIMFNLYDKLSIGGFFICDDYSVPEARKAVHEFRERHGISNSAEPIIELPDGVGAFWRKQTEPLLDMEWYLGYRAQRGLGK